MSYSNNNIEWQDILIGRPFRKIMCRIGVWFLNRAGITISEWIED